MVGGEGALLGRNDQNCGGGGTQLSAGRIRGPEEFPPRGFLLSAACHPVNGGLFQASGEDPSGGVLPIILPWG